MAAPPSRPASVGSLMFLTGPRKGTEYRLPQGDTRIGRAALGNNLTLAGDDSVSGEHILIREEHGIFTLYDRGAHFGTFVNGHRVERPVPLVHGDEITIGKTKLRLNILA